jgi:hypothetical protein
MTEKKTDKTPRRQKYTVACPNIYLDGKRHMMGDEVYLFADEAKAITDGDKAAGRNPRVVK